MNFLKRFFKSRPDLKEGFEDSNSKEHFAAINQPLFSEVGISFTLNETYLIESNNDLMNLATGPEFGSLQLIYLSQLVSDKLASIQNNSVLIDWQTVYSILSDIEHENSINLLGLPETDSAQPVLSEIGTVSDSFFRLQLTGWRNEGICRRQQKSRRNLHYLRSTRNVQHLLVHLLYHLGVCLCGPIFLYRLSCVHCDCRTVPSHLYGERGWCVGQRQEDR